MDTTAMIDPVTGELIDEQQLAEQLLRQAKEQGVDLLGPDGLLNGLTKRVLETALDAEMTEHLGRDKHQPAQGGNIRNGTRSKTVLTEVGPVQIDVPRDRDGSFDPKIVRKRQRRLTGVDEIVLSLTESPWVWFRFLLEDGVCPVSIRRSSGSVRSGCSRSRCLSMKPSTPRSGTLVPGLALDPRLCGSGVVVRRSMPANGPG